MFVRDIIIKDFPYLVPNDTGNKALDIMENYLIANLVVVNNDKVDGIVNMDDIYNFDLFDTRIEQFKNPITKAYIYENMHIFDAIRAMTVFDLSVLPVINFENFYVGTITFRSIIKHLSEIMPIRETGFYLMFSVPLIDYSPTEIANIIERNEAKLLTLYINDHPNSSRLDVFVKVQTTDIGSVLSSFEKHKYEVTLLNPERNDYDDMLQERFDYLLNFLKI